MKKRFFHEHEYCKTCEEEKKFYDKFIIKEGLLDKFNKYVDDSQSKKNKNEVNKSG